MPKGLTAFVALFFLLVSTSPLPNGQRLLANIQFEQAKNAFNKQDYFRAERLAHMAMKNAPDSAAPWLLLGHCFYLQDQDPAALYHYLVALRMDPAIGHLPPFY